jgi:hypothetical protein
MPNRGFWCRRPFLLKYLVAQLYTLIANKDAGSGYHLPDLVLALAAKAAMPLDLSGHAVNISV